MATVIGKLFHYGYDLLKGTKYGGVLVGKKLTLVPAKRLSRFVDNVEKYGFPFDTGMNISKAKSAEYIRRLGKAGGHVPTMGNNLSYHQGHAWTQIWDHDNNKPVLNVVERLSNPTREFIKNRIRNIF